MSENKDLVEFWNQAFSNQKPAKIAGKWVTDDTFNHIINKYIKKDDVVLDYGCGTGWAIIEIAYSVAIKLGVGIDTSANAIDFAKATQRLSNINNLIFWEGNELLLTDKKNYFDSVVSFNVIDVLPDEIIHSILNKIQGAMKKGAYFMVGINPKYPFELLKGIGYIQKDGYLFKDGILRGNEKNHNEWQTLFQQYFELIDYQEFALEEREKAYPRRMFILKK